MLVNRDGWLGWKEVAQVLRTTTLHVGREEENCMEEDARKWTRNCTTRIWRGSQLATMALGTCLDKKRRADKEES